MRRGHSLWCEQPGEASRAIGHSRSGFDQRVVIVRFVEARRPGCGLATCPHAGRLCGCWDEFCPVIRPRVISKGLLANRTVTLRFLGFVFVALGVLWIAGIDLDA